MSARAILYISGILIYVVFRSVHPAPDIDRITIINDTQFQLNNELYNQANLSEVIREFRKTIPPDQKARYRIAFEVYPDVKMGLVQDVKNELRKNGFRYLVFKAKPWWKFWV